MKIAVRILMMLGLFLAMIGATLIGGPPALLLTCGAAIFFGGLVDILKESK